MVKHHADASTLALYREGAISDRKAARIAGHLAVCSVCAEVDAQLASVATLLSRVELPPMPSPLADRIELALVAEQAKRGVSARHVSTQDAAGSPGGATARDPGRLGRPARSSRKHRWVRMPDLTSPRLVRGLAAATGAVLLLAGVGYVLASRITPPARVTSHAAAPLPSHIGSRPAFMGRTSLSAGSRQLSYTRDGKSVTYEAAALTENFTPADLAGKIRARMVTYAKVVPTTLPGATASPAPAVGGQSGNIGGIAISRLGGCLSRIAAGRQVLVAIVARYQGAPATIVVLEPLSGSSGFYNVIVVGPACSASDAHIVARTTVPSR